MNFSDDERSRIIEMAWEDRTPFEAIERLFGLNEPAVRKLMRKELKPRSFRLWRERVSGRVTKHQKLRCGCVERLLSDSVQTVSLFADAECEVLLVINQITIYRGSVGGMWKKL